MLDIILEIFNRIVIISISGAVIIFILEASAKRVIKYSLTLKKTKNEIYVSQTDNNISILRFQAFERLTIFLERINPYSIVVRYNSVNKSAIELQYELITSIREEFEHNFSQQIYISAEAWELVKNAKEEIIKIINDISNSLPDGSSSVDLAQTLMTSMIEKGETLSSKAIDVLKKEASYYM